MGRVLLSSRWRQTIDQSPLIDHSADTNGAVGTQDATSRSEALVPDKVHIRGVDDLTTEDIKAFSLEHSPDSPVARVEWIDDSSANIIYDAPATALEALLRFTSQTSPLSSDLSALDLRAAKAFTSRPESHLRVRLALITDRKRPRAHETSRFYLLHPEHDPRELRRASRGRDSSRRDYKKRRYSDEEDSRRRRRDVDDGFDASMYDDNDPSAARDLTASSPTGRVRREIDSYHPARDRSASPARQNGEGLSRRKRTPPPSYRPHDPNPFPKQNRDKELFPTKNVPPEDKDLFSNRILARKIKKDLFPHKANMSHHRRSDAFDAADETADLFAGRMSVPLTDGASEGKSLGDRVTRASESYGRLGNPNGNKHGNAAVIQSNNNGDQGINIRGVSNGLSIRGGASSSHAGTIKELFPGKANTGKELFSERLKGRGGTRTKAEDLFY